MKLLAFEATDAATALTRVHAELGPEAVVVNVRRLPPSGLERLWKRHGNIEVTACVPDPAEPPEQESAPRPLTPGDKNDPPPKGRWRSIQWLESKGLLAEFASQLDEKVRILHGDRPPETLEKEWNCVTDLVVCHWRTPPKWSMPDARPHVLVGPPGAGKSTALCKWMVQSILVQEKTVQIWRLDGATANASEILQLHCESLGVPTFRFWHTPDLQTDLLMVDLPGVEIHDTRSLAVLQKQLQALPNPHIHLVLNAALETSILQDQYRFFKQLNPEDMIFTHLDEERQRVKLWNFVLGTECPIRFLGTGQKIPGDLQVAEPFLLFPQPPRC